MKLGEVAKVTIGVLINREHDDNALDTYKIFNLKKYEDGQKYDELKSDRYLEDKITKKGDILFRLVWPNKIIYIDEEQEDLLVPSQLCIIRPNQELVNSKYLKWYLESNLGQEQIMINLNGSSIQKMSVTDLKKIEIPIIDRDKQEVIKDLIEVWNDEKMVLQEMIDTKEMLYNNIIEEIIEGGDKVGAKSN